ncbi:MAG: site-2 protease family protein [Peptococcaceae bacterium]|nr:site-2 protease family protein [Peptococcaceae bacterium]
MKILRIFGVQLWLSPFFLLVLAMYVGLGVWLQAVAVFALVFCHEWAHILVAKGYGIEVKSVELLPFGGVARVEGLFEIDPVIETWVAVAGPASNLLLALAGIVLGQTGWLGRELCDFFIKANLTVALFNFIPILPLDGGRVLRAWLTRKIGYRKATRNAAWAGQIGGIVLSLGGVVGLLLQYNDFSPVLIGILVYLAARKEENSAQFVFLRYLRHKQNELLKKGVLPTHALAVRSDYPVKEVIKRILPQQFTIVHVVNSEFKLAAILTETQLIQAMFEQGIDYPVGEVDRRT